MNEPSTPSGTTTPGLTVLYDGACPLCRREIALYRGVRGDVPLCFADVSDETVGLPPSLTRDTALARFHVRRADGQIVSGAQAFLALWSVLPGWRWLARIGRIPGVAWVETSRPACSTVKLPRVHGYPRPALPTHRAV